MLQRVRSSHTKISTAVSIGVDVNRSMLHEFVRMRFGPLSRAQQHRLLAIPCAVNNGAARFPSLFEKFAESSGFFEQRHLPGDWVFGPVHPRIVMIAAHDPL